jgi:hypothetical protein
MHRDFEIISGIYLSKPPRKLDLHNNFDFHAVLYSVADRTASLFWRRCPGDWVPSSTPAAVCIEFREVSEFRFLPREPGCPFTEDDCVREFGYWTDQKWPGFDGGVILEPSQGPEADWLTAISFMSGATILVQAVFAHAQIQES